MDDESADELRDVVVLKYRQPRWMRWAWSLYLMSALLLPFLVWSMWQSSDREPLIVLLFGSLIVVAVVSSFVWFAVRSVVEFSCTNSGINAVTFSGRREHIDWREVRALNHVNWRFDVIVSHGHPSLCLSLPRPVLDRLISILQEASDARVVWTAPRWLR